MSESTIVIPRHKDLSEFQKNKTSVEYEHSWQVLLVLIGGFIKQIPKILFKLGLPLLVLTGLNIMIETIPTYSTTGFLKVLLMVAVFVTSSYNSPAPRALYWVLILTIGKRLFYQAKHEGVSKVLNRYKLGLPYLKSLDIKKYQSLTVLGLGLGFLLANVLTRNNRMDKTLVTYVLAFSVLDLILRKEDSLVATFFRLLFKDLGRSVTKDFDFGMVKFHILSLGFMFGLLGNTINAFTKWDDGGYIMGSVLVVVSIVLMFIGKTNED
jgi:hypothetical protein